MDTANLQLEGWHTHILPRATEKALKFLAQQQWLEKSDWYLAGGTAMALQTGHRQSVDLDFFSKQKTFVASHLIDRFVRKDFMPDIIREGTIYGRLLGAKISFIAYPFFVPKQKPRFYGTVRILQLLDIAIMKIIAISQRGRKRDFIDLYWHCVNKEPLFEIVRCLPSQYPYIAHDYHHIIKSLTYFDDAEKDPMPKLFFKASWGGVKKYFQAEVPKVAREILKLS